MILYIMTLLKWYCLYIVCITYELRRTNLNTYYKIQMIKVNVRKWNVFMIVYEVVQYYVNSLLNICY